MQLVGQGLRGEGAPVDPFGRWLEVPGDGQVGGGAAEIRRMIVLTPVSNDAKRKKTPSTAVGPQSPVKCSSHSTAREAAPDASSARPSGISPASRKITRQSISW